MPPTASPDEPRRFDPAHRYRAVERAAARARAEGESYDLLDALTESVHGSSSWEPAEGQDVEEATRAELAEVRRGVVAAVQSFDSQVVQPLFDACLIAGATAEQLAVSFAVDPREYAAYKWLFFDRDVFPNAFHLVQYIATRPHEQEQLLLRTAQSQGFEAIASQYGIHHPVTPENALENVLAADAATYRRYRDLPITHQATKEVRALGKQVVATAQAIQKVQDSKSAVAARLRARNNDEEFVLVTGTVNPTLQQLLEAGGEMALPTDSGV